MVVQAVSNAWNLALANRASAEADRRAVETARRYFSDTEQEYRVGQRSTLDVLIAEQALRAEEVASAQAEHDCYLAQAALLSALGRLEAADLIEGAPRYDPAQSFRKIRLRDAVPWEGAVAGLRPPGRNPDRVAKAARRAGAGDRSGAARRTADPRRRRTGDRPTHRAVARHDQPVDAARAGRGPRRALRDGALMASTAPIARPAANQGPLREALSLCGSHLRFAVLFSAIVNVAYLAPTLYMLQVYDRVVPSGSQPTLLFLTLALAATLFLLTYLDRMRGRILLAASVRLNQAFAGRIFSRALASAARGPPIRLNQMVRDFDTIRSRHDRAADPRAVRRAVDPDLHRRLLHRASADRRARARRRACCWGRWRC